MSLNTITTLDQYLKTFGPTLARKAVDSLDPLHVPGRDELPDFSAYLREPFTPQQHVVTAAVKMLDEGGSGFVVGEMGVGKSLIGVAAIHEHAARSRRKGGRGGKYRALVLCPDHLIDKWKEEIETTIPGVTVTVFNKSNSKKADDSWKAVLALATRRANTKVGQAAHWAKPEGPEWFVVGRNQVKFDPDWLGVGETHPGFDGVHREGRCVRQVVIDHVPKVDEEGRPVRDRKTGNQLRAPVLDDRVLCPVCGAIARNEKLQPLTPEQVIDKQVKCRGRMLREQPVADAPKTLTGLDLIPLEGDWVRNHPWVKGDLSYEKCKPGKKLTFKDCPNAYVATECGEPLYNWIAQPNKWAPAKIVQRQLRRFFHYCVIDEVHEQKSDESAQSMAAGKLMASVKHTLALTGTLIGGYAHHLFPLLIRMCGQSLRDEGFEWGKEMPFNQMYGRVDTIITTKSAGGSEPSRGGRGRNVKSMRRVSGGGSRESRPVVKPGIMPALFGRHLLGNSVFITLEEMVDELPDLHEYVADGGCDMLPEQAQEYRRIKGELAAANRELLTKGSTKLLGATLHTLLDYPDRPYGWDVSPEIAEYLARTGEKIERDGNGMAVGYWDLPGNRQPYNWVGVVQPADLDRDLIYPKERKLLDICKERIEQGRQVWVYCQMTGKRDVQGRLQKLLEREGIKAGILRRDTVSPRNRIDWIRKNGPKYQVILSHPQLVSTGLELFDTKHFAHNFSTLIFYETGYNLFTMRQASRRSWRIGQPLDCEVFYLYYKNTMQHDAMRLMSRKLQAATALEGEFSAEGLSALAGNDDGQMEMARAVTAGIGDVDMQRGWGKVKSSARQSSVTSRQAQAFAPLSLPFREPDALDATPPAYQLVADAIIAASAAERERPPTLRMVGGGTALLSPPRAPALGRPQLAKMFAYLQRTGTDLDELLSDD